MSNKTKFNKGLQYSNNDADRQENDFYITPIPVVLMLTDFLKSKELIDESDTILEPMCGNGVISVVLENEFGDVISSDISDKHFIYGATSLDFLTDYDDFIKQKYKFDYVISNPPYKDFESYLNKAKQIADKVCFLLRLQCLEGIKRFDNNTFNNLKYVLIPIDRVDTYKFEMVKNNPEILYNYKGISGMISYCWFVFDKDYIDEPMIVPIDSRKYKGKQYPEILNKVITI